MSWIKRAVIISLFFLHGACSASDDLLISAESVEYDKEGLSIEASGGVVLLYQDIELKAGHLTFYTADKRALADKGFVLKTEDQFIEGEVLDYFIGQRSGEARGVNVRYKGLYLTGDSIRVSPDSIVLDGASFTSCEEPRPHYRITAANMTLYPKKGMLYAYLGWFHLLEVPILPVPTYVYDTNQGSRDRNVAPLPEVGKNEEDGFFVIERLSWHINNQTYGMVDLSYAENQGLGGGVEGEYLESDDVRYNARLHTAEKDGWWGGFTYSRSFGLNGAVATDRQKFLGLIDPKKIWLSVDLSSRERINFERVSLLPEVTIGYRTDDLIWNLRYNWKANSGRIFEESTALDLSRSGFDGKLIYEFPEMPFGVFEIDLEGVAQFYSQGSRWGQIFNTNSLTKVFNEHFGANIGYRHVMENRGSSPFVFENYRFRPKDYVFSGAYLEFYPLRVGVEISNYLPDMDPKEIDYLAIWHLGCMDITASYRAMRKEISFGFLLVTI